MQRFESLLIYLLIKKKEAHVMHIPTKANTAHRIDPILLLFSASHYLRRERFVFLFCSAHSLATNKYSYGSTVNVSQIAHGPRFERAKCPMCRENGELFAEIAARRRRIANNFSRLEHESQRGNAPPVPLALHCGKSKFEIIFDLIQRWKLFVVFIVMIE